VTFVNNGGKCLYFQNRSKLQVVFSVWLSLSYNFCRIVKFILRGPEHKMCFYTDNICNRKYVSSRSLCLCESEHETLCTQFVGKVHNNNVSVINALLYCNSVFPLRHFHRHVGTWPTAAFPHSSSSSNIPLLATNTTTIYSKRRETENHVGVLTDTSVLCSLDRASSW